MTTVLYAQPYDIEATGFYFESAEDYAEKVAANVNRFGAPVEEYEIQFIDGEAIDAALAKALGLHQGKIQAFFELAIEWEWHEKVRYAIAVGECGARFDPVTDSIDLLDVDIYEMECLRELAEHFVDEGLFGEIPERLQFYIDLDAIARDLSCDYSETEIAGTRLIYRCG